MNEIDDLIKIASEAKGFNLKLNLNEVELRFFETYLDWAQKDDNAREKLQAQVEIGPYRVDFLYNNRYIIEIDGQEHHSTQKQRERDYGRERYLQQRGYEIIRFTAKEVFEQARACITQMMEIVYSQKNVWRDYLEEKKLCS